MRDALVIGSVTSTVKHPCLHGKKLLIVQVLNVKGEPEGRPQIVVDFTGAGKGDRVLLSWDGIGSQEYHNDPQVPQRAWLGGIIDETYIAATIERAGENESAGIGRSGN